MQEGEPPPLAGLALAAALLLLNGAFVAAEFAYVGLNRGRLERMARGGSTAARLLLASLSHLDTYIAAAQLGITMASIGLGWVAEPALARLLEPWLASLLAGQAAAGAHVLAGGITFALVTAAHLVVGEFLPKTLALEKPDTVALRLAVPLRMFVRVFRPLVLGLNQAGFALARRLGVDTAPLKERAWSSDELARALEESASRGLLSEWELELSERVLELQEASAGELMIPRTEVVGISEDASVQEVLATFMLHRHTRYPVYRGSLDHVVGILDARSLLLDLGSGVRGGNGARPAALSWQRYVTPPLFLPETIPVPQLLEAMRRHRQPLAVLVDEFGGTAGVVSAFDVVEHVGGELPDEFDREPPELVRNPDGTLSVTGWLRLDELARALDRELPELEEAEVDSIGGLVMARLNRIPQVGDEVRVAGLRLRVKAMDGHRVDRLLVIPDPEVDAGEGRRSAGGG